MFQPRNRPTNIHGIFERYRARMAPRSECPDHEGVDPRSMPDENKQLFHNFIAAFHPCNISRRIRRNPGIYGPSIHQLVNALESLDGHCPCAFTRWLWNLPEYTFDD